MRGGIQGGLQPLARLPNEIIVKPVQRGLSAMTMATLALAVLYVVMRK